MENSVIRNEVVFLIVPIHQKYKITSIASADAKKLNFLILRKNRLIGTKSLINRSIQSYKIIDYLRVE